MSDDHDDLVWHGRALCRALHRAWEAEREVEELRATVAALLELGRIQAGHRVRVDVSE